MQCAQANPHASAQGSLNRRQLVQGRCCNKAHATGRVAAFARRSRATSGGGRAGRRCGVEAVGGKPCLGSLEGACSWRGEGGWCGRAAAPRRDGSRSDWDTCRAGGRHAGRAAGRARGGETPAGERLCKWGWAKKGQAKGQIAAARQAAAAAAGRAPLSQRAPRVSGAWGGVQASWCRPVTPHAKLLRERRTFVTPQRSDRSGGVGLGPRGRPQGCGDGSVSTVSARQ